MNTVIFDVFVADRLEVTYLEPELMGCFVDSCDLSFFLQKTTKQQTTKNKMFSMTGLYHSLQQEAFRVATLLLEKTAIQTDVTRVTRLSLFKVQITQPIH